MAESFIASKIQVLNPSIQAVYLFGFLKIYSRCQGNLNIGAENLACFINSTDLQVQDRACLVLAILEENNTLGLLNAGTAANPWVEKVTWTKAHISKCFDGSLNMVAPLAQANVPLTIDLNTWLVPLTAEDTKLLESPTRTDHATSAVESLLTELANQADLEDKDGQGSGSKSPAIGSSVLFRPEPKKYNLNLAFDGQELLAQSNKVEETDTKGTKKKKSGSRTKLLPAKLERQVVLIFKRDNLLLTGSFDHVNRDSSALELHFEMGIAILPFQSFVLELPNQAQYPSGLIPVTLTRGDASDYFPTSFYFKLILEKVTTILN